MMCPRGTERNIHRRRTRPFDEQMARQRPQSVMPYVLTALSLLSSLSADAAAAAKAGASHPNYITDQSEAILSGGNFPPKPHRKLDEHLGNDACYDNRCQDDPLYRTSAGLSCADHHGLLKSDENCLHNWFKSGGKIQVQEYFSYELAEEELLDLIKACPCACNTDCGDTHAPSKSPAPSVTASSSPSVAPTSSPSSTPTRTSRPSFIPSASPSSSPSGSPTSTPSFTPTAMPSASPSAFPTSQPSSTPSFTPSATPSSIPSISPTFSPSFSPSAAPSSSPSTTLTSIPSFIPTAAPSSSPSFFPSAVPSSPTPTSLPATLSPTTKPGNDLPVVSGESRSQEIRISGLEKLAMGRSNTASGGSGSPNSILFRNIAIFLGSIGMLVAVGAVIYATVLQKRLISEVSVDPSNPDDPSPIATDDGDGPCATPNITTNGERSVARNITATGPVSPNSMKNIENAAASLFRQAFGEAKSTPNTRNVSFAGKPASLAELRSRSLMSKSRHEGVGSCSDSRYKKDSFDDSVNTDLEDEDYITYMRWKKQKKAMKRAEIGKNHEPQADDSSDYKSVVASVLEWFGGGGSDNNQQSKSPDDNQQDEPPETDIEAVHVCPAGSASVTTIRVTNKRAADSGSITTIQNANK